MFEVDCRISEITSQSAKSPRDVLPSFERVNSMVGLANRAMRSGTVLISVSEEECELPQTPWPVESHRQMQ